MVATLEVLVRPQAKGQWVDDFVGWYNTQHLHRGIGFVTPEDRHTGLDEAILTARRKTYEAAQKRQPERWAGNIRKWKRADVVTLNPEPENVVKKCDNHLETYR